MSSTRATEPLTPEQRVVGGDTQVTVLRAGSGDPLVFFHGAGTAVGFDFAASWADDFEVILPFHPGFGSSPLDTRLREVRDLVPHYLQLLDDVCPGPVNMVGHSLGGWIASLVAIHAPERVRRLVLACPAGLRVPSHPTTDLFSLAPRELAARLTSRPELLGSPESVTVDSVVRQYEETTSLARLIWERNHDRTLQQWLGRISAPTLVLWGTADRIIPVEQADVWASRLPRSQVTTIEGAGHMLFNESAAAVDAVSSFLREP
ncbi:MAG: alpha/beta hydrolase [Blastococcus sp.]|jgi:pimeloyl-ACP methyl ester carboxylesterase|nr:alpha/beta hydrolase [Blastococcus sp.]